MKKNQLILGLVVLAALVGLALYAQHEHPFDFHAFGEQFRLADWKRIAIGVGCIYLAYVFRSVRWALLLRHIKKQPLFSLIGTQVMGFTAVALIGRVADLVRPYLVAKKTRLPIGSQIAVYIVERLFDAGSMALIFSIAMLWIPEAEILKATSHSKSMAALAQHSPFLMSLVARFGGLLLTLLGALFLVAVRMSGEVVARLSETAFGLISKKLGVAIGEKIRAFRAGLGAMQSFSDFAAVAFISITMWALIAFAYLESCRAFTASPELAAITLPKCILLMIASGSASIVQLPVLGWFTQIGIVAAALSAIVGSSAEASTACAAVLLGVTFLCIVPVGLVWAQFEHVSLRGVAAESEHVAEVTPVTEPVAEEPSGA